MAAQDSPPGPDHAVENDEVTTKVIEKMADTSHGTKLSPWMIAKAHQKITAGKKNALKTSKRGTCGGKVKKKGASKTKEDEQQNGSGLPTSPAVDSQANHNEPFTASMESSCQADDKQEKTNDVQQEKLDSMYVQLTSISLSVFLGSGICTTYTGTIRGVGVNYALANIHTLL